MIGNKDVYNHAKKGQLILNHSDGYIPSTDALNSLFYKNILDFTRFRTFFLGFFLIFFYFYQDFIPVILFPETLLTAANHHTIIIIGKKSQESKTQEFVSADIFSKDLRKFGLLFQV